MWREVSVSPSACMVGGRGPMTAPAPDKTSNDDRPDQGRHIKCAIHLDPIGLINTSRRRRAVRAQHSCLFVLLWTVMLWVIYELIGGGGIGEVFKAKRGSPTL